MASADPFSTLPRRRQSLRERLTGSLRGSFRGLRRRSSGDAPVQLSWIHEDQTLQQDSVRYNVKYLGFKETQQAKGSDVIIQAIAALKSNSKKHRASSRSPWLSLFISQDSLRLVDDSTPDEPVLIFEFATHRVSSVSEYKQDDIYFGMTIRHGRLGQHKVHIFETDHESQNVALTLAQAFHLAFSRYMQIHAEDDTPAVARSESMVMRDVQERRLLAAADLNGQFMARPATPERARLSMKWLTEARDCSLSHDDQQLRLVRNAESIATEEPAIGLDQEHGLHNDEEISAAMQIAQAVSSSNSSSSGQKEDAGLDALIALSDPMDEPFDIPPVRCIFTSSASGERRIPRTASPGESQQSPTSPAVRSVNESLEEEDEDEDRVFESTCDDNGTISNGGVDVQENTGIGSNNYDCTDPHSLVQLGTEETSKSNSQGTLRESDEDTCINANDEPSEETGQHDTRDSRIMDDITSNHPSTTSMSGIPHQQDYSGDNSEAALIDAGTPSLEEPNTSTESGSMQDHPGKSGRGHDGKSDVCQDNENEVDMTEHIQDSIEALDAAEALDTAEEMDTVEALDAAEALDTAEATYSVKAPDTVETPDAAQASGTVEAPDTVETPDAAQASGTVEAPDSADALDTVEAVDSAEALATVGLGALSASSDSATEDKGIAEPHCSSFQDHDPPVHSDRAGAISSDQTEQDSKNSHNAPMVAAQMDLNDSNEDDDLRNSPDSLIVHEHEHSPGAADDIAPAVQQTVQAAHASCTGLLGTGDCVSEINDVPDESPLVEGNDAGNLGRGDAFTAP